MTKVLKLCTGPASQMGWTRRPEMDSTLTDAWEMANGHICRVTRGREPEVQRLDRVEELGAPS